MEELALLGGARSAMICDSRRSCRQCVGATPLTSEPSRFGYPRRKDPAMGNDYGNRSRTKTYLKLDSRDKKYIDYKSVEDLRRLMTPNGKIYSRKRLSTSAKQQRMVAQAIKRARFMALLPFTSGTM